MVPPLWEGAKPPGASPQGRSRCARGCGAAADDPGSPGDDSAPRVPNRTLCSPAGVDLKAAGASPKRSSTAAPASQGDIEMRRG